MSHPDPTYEPDNSHQDDRVEEEYEETEVITSPPDEPDQGNYPPHSPSGEAQFLKGLGII